MRRVLGCAALLLLPVLAGAQGVRFTPSAITTTTTVAGITNIYQAVNGSAIAFCNAPNVGVPCTNKAITYTDATLTTPCGLSSQVVLDGASSCVSAPDSLGNWGVFAPPGQYAYTVTTSGGASFGPFYVTLGSGIVSVASFAGATADVKFANACAALSASGGTLDARGFGAGNQTIAATVQCGSSTKPVAILFDPATVYQPSTASTNMFQVGQFNVFSGLHIDTTNQATYSGKPISNAAQSISWFRLDHTFINMASGSTGPCVNFTGTSASIFVQFTETNDLVCFGGTAANGFNFASSGGGWVNANHFSGVRIYNTQFGVELNQAGAGGVSSNIFSDYEFEASSLATALAAVHIDAAGGGGNANRNQFYMNAWDLQGSNKGVITTSTSNACGNLFSGTLVAITDGGSSCAVPNQFIDLFGNIGGVWQTAYMNVGGALKVTGAAGLTLGSVVVGSLPSAAANPGAMYRVSDSTAVASEGQTCVGSSTNNALAFSNGTVWKCF